MSLFCILLAGDLSRTTRLDAQIAGARVIAADAGIRHAATLGVTPELWLGDFDSSLADDLAGRNIPVRKFLPEKDKTDGELAVQEALLRGARSLILAGAFGGPRPDHAFFHLALALRVAEAGTPVLLTSGAQEGVPLLSGATDFDYEAGALFSILGFSALSKLSVEGARWPLDRVEVPFGSSWTMSNRVSGTLRVTLGAGCALLLAYPDPASEH